MSGYTVIDVETTGLDARRHDRIVEIGVVYVSDQGDIQDQWSTLVNPGRDVGPTEIHGITARDVAHAPTFKELAPYVVRAVDHRTVVAHNAPFDMRFLGYALGRCGYQLDVPPCEALCTMQWSSHYLHAASRRLADCCAAAGITLTGAHSALSDATATAQLLGLYLREAGAPPPWAQLVTRSRTYDWPPHAGPWPDVAMLPRDGVPPVRDGAWLDGIIAGMPRLQDAEVESYLAVLEMALLDRYLSEHEQQTLTSVAFDLGLTRGQLVDIHADYLDSMARVALADGVVSDDERDDLDHVAAMLGLRPNDVVLALQAAQQNLDRHAGPAPAPSGGFQLEPGDRVVFTGDMETDRDVWIARAKAAGLDPGGVTKSTKVVVAADPDSLSGKAKKARGYGVPIVTEDAFDRLLKEMGARVG